MGQKQQLAEKLSSIEVALVPTDTLLCALRLMERCHRGLLPVVGEAGRLVGIISKAHILSAWEVNPLLPVSLVMAACEPHGGALGGPFSMR
jgi:predicted transcriptional regulator